MTRSAEELAAFQPLSGLVMPRFAGPTTFFRLPQLAIGAASGKVDIGVLGIPFDAATTNRPGARLGPRQVREASCLIRLVNEATRVNPYVTKAVCDVGDVAVNPVNVVDTLERIEATIESMVAGGMTPLSVGGDHLVTLPILRALSKARPLGMIHVDAHSDTWDSYFGGERLTHGTPFRRAIEEGVLDPRRTVQIGIRGTMYSADERDWALSRCIRIIDMEEVAEKGLAAAIAEARRVVGEAPTYLTFDIDSVDPAFAPGTGTPEVGGLTSREALTLVRGFMGLELVGGDVVEVSPPLDPAGVTAQLGAAVLFEILCVLAAGPDGAFRAPRSENKS